MAAPYSASFRSAREALPAARVGIDSPRLHRPSAAVEAFVRAAERLEQAVEQETLALESRRGADLREFNHRKSHGLLELIRAMRGLEGETRGGHVAARLRTLHTKLERNQSVLKTHLDAVQEIVGIMAGAMRDADSDGTYGAALRYDGEVR